jgi:hypothetical protein
MKATLFALRSNELLGGVSQLVLPTNDRDRNHRGPTAVPDIGGVVVFQFEPLVPPPSQYFKKLPPV